MTNTYAIVLEIEPSYDATEDGTDADEFFKSVVTVVEEFTAWAALRNVFVQSSPAELTIDNNGYVVIRMEATRLA